MKIKKDDTVRVMAGKDKGKEGKVLRTLKKTGRVVVDGINIRTRHIKKSAQQAGQKVQYPAPFNASNVMVLDPKSGKPTRVGYIVGKDGKKVRVAKKSGEALDSKSAKKAAAKKATKKDSKKKAA